MIVSARDHRGPIIAIFDLFILNRKRVNIEPVRIEKISKLFRTNEIESFGETQVGPYLKQPLDNFERCETLCRIPKGCHINSKCAPDQVSGRLYDYDTVRLVVRKKIFCELFHRASHRIDNKKLRILRRKPTIVETLPKGEHIMKSTVSRSFALFAALISMAVCSFAQSETISAALGDKYVISAKAGGVNYVEGAVGVVRKSGQSGRLIKGDSLKIGDRVSTGNDGKAEILLNPGSYIRLGGSSAFEFKTTSLDDLQLLVESGSAMLEVHASNDFTVRVQTPDSIFVIVQSGIYRVDVAGKNGRLSVLKGKALVDGSADAEIKKGRQGVLVNGQASIAKFKSSGDDGLEAWSKSRAKEMAKISSSLDPRTLRPTLMRSFLGNRWNMFDSFGLWVYDPFRRYHCFLPFGRGWGSPYGYWYGWDIWHYNLPPVIYLPPTQPPSTPNKVSSRVPRSMASEAPPFMKMEGESRGRRVFDNPVDTGAGKESSRTFEPPPVIVSAPVQRSTGQKP